MIVNPISSKKAAKAKIMVTAPTGSTVTCDGIVGTESSGTWEFSVSKGNHTIVATLGTKTKTQNVLVDVVGTYNIAIKFTHIYGISRAVGISSTKWERTDDSVGYYATASVGATAGSSDFDECYPWSEMKRETFSTEDVMAKIPEFYYQRYVEDGVEYIKIADGPADGFTKHPGSGTYVGAYKTSSNNRSVANATPTVSQTRSTMRTNAKAKGDGWGLFDVSLQSAIRMLYLVEFADYDSQNVVGMGYCDRNSSRLSSGTCDAVPNLTGRPAGTNGKTDVVYRGIEGLWGNVSEWIDGLNINSQELWICLNQSKYADDTSSNYSKLSYSSPTQTAKYITEEGYDANNPWAILPSRADSSAANSSIPDAYWNKDGWTVAACSGNWSDGYACGLFTEDLVNTSSDKLAYIGSRLQYRPS